MSCATVLLLGASSACSPDKPPEPCGPREPAFAIQVTAGSGDELPSDTRITVAYGGTQTEAFELPQTRKNADVCCQVSTATLPEGAELPRVECTAPVVAPDAGTVRAIQCTLWTGGPAVVDVEATGYLDIRDQNLNTRLQEDEKCGVDTKDVYFSLGRPEGGI